MKASGGGVGGVCVGGGVRAYYRLLAYSDIRFVHVTEHESICVRTAHVVYSDHLSAWLVGFKQQP